MTLDQWEMKWLVVGVLVLIGDLKNRNGVSGDDCIVPAFAADLPQDRFLSYLTASCRYDKYALPETARPLQVDVSMTINHIEALQSQFTVYMSVHFNYEDSKLNFENVTTVRSVILGDENVRNQIWTPRVQLKNQVDTTIINAREEDILVSIDKTGSVTYSYKMVADFYCWMDLKKFPFDTQRCTLSFSDWSYNSSQLNLNWKNLTFARNLHFTEFVLDKVDYNDGTNDGPYGVSAFSDSVGDFTELTIKFKFHRDIGYYILDFYIPSYLLVLTAWVTFWLQADAGPPRATLGASTVIAFVTLHLGVGKDIPKVSYVKASDIWFLGISCFIFFSLAEFAFVNVIWRRRKMVELKKPKPKYILKSAVMPSRAREDLRRYESQISVTSQSSGLELPKSLNSGLNDFYRNSVNSSQETFAVGQTAIPMPEQQDFTWTTMTPQEVAIYVDRKARLIFPIVFLVFNIFYWVFVYYG